MPSGCGGEKHPLLKSNPGPFADSCAGSYACWLRM